MHSEAQNGNATAPQSEAESTPTVKREYSKIGFSYVPLETAEKGAKAIFEKAGTAEISLAQAANAMNTTVSSSAFRGDIGAMKLFGVIDGDQGRVRLTDLGRAISEAQTVDGARVKAFARIPLYFKVIQDHGGKSLPKPAALEAEFIQHGVNRKQVERARQVFERSARHAGFLNHGSDRFCAPIINDRHEGKPTGNAAVFHQDSGNKEQDQSPRRAGGGGRELHPFIEGLLETLPQPGKDWTTVDQIKWLQTAASIFGLIYVCDGTVEVKQAASISAPSASLPPS